MGGTSFIRNHCLPGYALECKILRPTIKAKLEREGWTGVAGRRRVAQLEDDIEAVTDLVGVLRMELRLCKAAQEGEDESVHDHGVLEKEPQSVEQYRAAHVLTERMQGRNCAERSS